MIQRQLQDQDAIKTIKMHVDTIRNVSATEIRNQRPFDAWIKLNPRE